MKQILCEACGLKRNLVAGQRIAFEANGPEPAEYERVVWGVALIPRPEQRVMLVNGAPIPLPPREYTCDLCSASIKPGERCCAWSAWPDGYVCEAWERDFIQADGAAA